MYFREADYNEKSQNTKDEKKAKLGERILDKIMLSYCGYQEASKQAVKKIKNIKKTIIYTTRILKESLIETSNKIKTSGIYLVDFDSLDYNLKVKVLEDAIGNKERSHNGESDVVEMVKVKKMNSSSPFMRRANIESIDFGIPIKKDIAKKATGIRLTQSAILSDQDSIFLKCLDDLMDKSAQMSDSEFDNALDAIFSNKPQIPPVLKSKEIIRKALEKIRDQDIEMIKNEKLKEEAKKFEKLVEKVEEKPKTKKPIIKYGNKKIIEEKDNARQKMVEEQIKQHVKTGRRAAKKTK